MQLSVLLKRRRLSQKPLDTCSARLGAGKFFRAIGPYASLVFKLFTKFESIVPSLCE